ncbi:MAG: hypothetical protein VB144_10755 [Clostridia bacterium]|nr:hypothetical protein [Clostridia bacterium]
MRFADTSMSIYQQARARHDEDAAARSLGYAATCIDSAAESSVRAQEALKKAQLEAKERAEDEQETGAQRLTTNTPAPVDTVEISKEGRTVTEGKPDAETVHSTEPAADAVDDPVVYTSLANTAPVAVQPRLSVIA